MQGRRLTVLTALVLVAGCAGSSATPTPVPNPTTLVTPAVPPTPSPTLAPTPSPMPAFPIIPGLSSDAVTQGFTKRGLTCTTSVGPVNVLHKCVRHGATGTEEAQWTTRSLTDPGAQGMGVAAVGVGDPSTDDAFFRSFLGYAASLMVYDGSVPDAASQWLAANIGSKGATATFGQAIWILSADSSSRQLVLTPLGQMP
jgi:hypothetical protein